MKSEKINDWLQIVGMIGIMASLIFVGVQVRQTQRVGQGQEYYSFIELSQGLRSLQLQHIDVWQKVCAGDELKGDERQTGALLFRSYIEFVYVAGASNQINLTQAEHDLFAYRLAANLHRYPGFARMMEVNSAWSRQGEASLNDKRTLKFANAVRARLVELQKQEPNPDYDLMWCGV